MLVWYERPFENQKIQFKGPLPGNIWESCAGSAGVVHSVALKQRKSIMSSPATDVCTSSSLLGVVLC